MKANTASLLLMLLLATTCGWQQTNSDGSGPDNADQYAMFTLSGHTAKT